MHAPVSTLTTSIVADTAIVGNDSIARVQTCSVAHATPITDIGIAWSIAEV